MDTREQDSFHFAKHGFGSIDNHDSLPSHLRHNHRSSYSSQHTCWNGALLYEYEHNILLPAIASEWKREPCLGLELSSSLPPTIASQDSAMHTWRRVPHEHLITNGNSITERGCSTPFPFLGFVMSWGWLNSCSSKKKKTTTKHRLQNPHEWCIHHLIYWLFTIQTMPWIRPEYLLVERFFLGLSGNNNTRTTIWGGNENETDEALRNLDRFSFSLRISHACQWRRGIIIISCCWIVMYYKTVSTMLCSKRFLKFVYFESSILSIHPSFQFQPSATLFVFA